MTPQSSALDSVTFPEPESLSSIYKGSTNFPENSGVGLHRAHTLKSLIFLPLSFPTENPSSHTAGDRLDFESREVWRLVTYYDYGLAMISSETEPQMKVAQQTAEDDGSF
ncbi:50S ribosomal protein L27 [Striga asiatica]|uniref:50S ribosomal protein L27 n=1 Tax=Striga asiatica TaxID=4170 RepID=A0A5A7RDQ6_STRAF|nr:50S ribosomal protein L27 [Striga asiatica]